LIAGDFSEEFQMHFICKKLYEVFAARIWSFYFHFLHAQFAFYASGGGNYSHLRVTRNPGGIMEGKGGVGGRQQQVLSIIHILAISCTLKRLFRTNI
jgi:hypothetical protein